jgi:hypothetical protein
MMIFVLLHFWNFVRREEGRRRIVPILGVLEGKWTNKNKERRSEQKE